MSRLIGLLVRKDANLSIKLVQKKLNSRNFQIHSGFILDMRVECALNAYIYTHTHIYTPTRIHIYTYTKREQWQWSRSKDCIHATLHPNIDMCIHVPICKYIYMYIYIYTRRRVAVFARLNTAYTNEYM